jgi:hypothetical protein
MSSATANKSYVNRGRVANPCKKGAPNRKQMARLTANLSGWEKTMNDPLNRAKNMSGYHKPGSMQ